MSKKDVNISISAENNTAQGLRGATDGIEGLNNKLKQLAFRYADVFAAIGSGAVMKSAVDSAREWGLAVNDLVDSTGMADKEASKWLYTAQVMGLTTEEVTNVTGKFSSALMSARDSMKAASDAGKLSNDVFSRYGISITDAKGNMLGFEKVLRNVLDVHRSMENGIEKNNMERLIFGKSGMKLNDLLNLTNEELEQYAENARKAGLVMEDGASAGTEAFDRSMRELELTTKGLQVQLGEALIPKVKKASESIMDMIYWYNGLPDPVKRATEAIIMMSAGLSGLTVAMRIAAAAGGPLLWTMAAIGALAGTTSYIAGSIEGRREEKYGKKIDWYQGKGKADVYLDDSGNYTKKVEVSTPQYTTNQFGRTYEYRPPTKSIENQPLSEAEIAKVKGDSKNPLIQAQEAADKVKAQHETMMRDYSSGGGSSSIDKAAKEVENATRKLQSAIQSMNREISQEVDSIFKTEELAIKDEIEKLQTEIKAADRVGVDTTKTKETLAQYESVLKEKNLRGQRRREAEYLAEMLGLEGQYFGNKRKLIESDFETSVAALEEERQEKYRQVGDKIKADEWYDMKLAVLKKEREDKLLAENRTEMENQLARVGLLGELEGKTQNQISLIRRETLNQQIALLREQLQAENLSAEERLNIERQLASSIRELRSEQGNDPSMAFSEGIRRIRDQTHDYAGDVVNTYNSIFSSFEENIASAIDGSKSFSDAMKDMSDSVIKDMIRMYTRMLMNMLMAKMLGGVMGGGGGGGSSDAISNINDFVGNALSGIGIPGFASGGTAYPGQTIVVGEKGPEIMEVGHQSQIYSNKDSRRMVGGGSSAPGPIEVRVINQTGQEVQATQSEAKFDGETMIITMVLKALANNKGGSRDMLKGMMGV